MCSDCGDFRIRGLSQFPDFGVDGGIAVENIAELQQVGFEGQHLLQAQAPLLVPRARQAHGFVPGRQLHGSGSGALRQRNGQSFQQDAVDVVFRLALGQAQRVHLHAITEAPHFGVLDPITLTANIVPHIGEGPHLAHLGQEADAGIHEKADAADDAGEVGIRHLA